MADLDVCAEISGLVSKVSVGAGDAVVPGQEVAVLEAMKMEIPVESPAHGSVLSVLVSPGDMVEEGQLLLRLSV